MGLKVNEFPKTEASIIGSGNIDFLEISFLITTKFRKNNS